MSKPDSLDPADPAFLAYLATRQAQAAAVIDALESLRAQLHYPHQRRAPRSDAAGDRMRGAAWDGALAWARQQVTDELISWGATADILATPSLAAVLLAPIDALEDPIEVERPVERPAGE